MDQPAAALFKFPFTFTSSDNLLFTGVNFVFQKLNVKLKTFIIQRTIKCKEDLTCGDCLILSAKTPTKWSSIQDYIKQEINLSFSLFSLECGRYRMHLIASQEISFLRQPTTKLQTQPCGALHIHFLVTRLKFFCCFFFYYMFRHSIFSPFLNYVILYVTMYQHMLKFIFFLFENKVIYAESLHSCQQQLATPPTTNW